VSGAGDTALAGLSLAMAAGASLKDAMEFADLAAGVAVGKPGTATVSPEEILDAAQAGEEAPDWRVMSRPAMAELSADWRESGLKVGFTNGCFDLLHPGHLSVLRHAASVCDRLIVGLNADASVKRLKGENRPINDQATRATMLASLEMVDRVVIFDEDTPAELISEIRSPCDDQGGRLCGRRAAWRRLHPSVWRRNRSCAADGRALHHQYRQSPTPGRLASSRQSA
jgi:D-beta-D-heptose 7-phosphate kinase/D-beta-D-heptose 1-phosphate adenosyltransferase